MALEEEITSLEKALREVSRKLYAGLYLYASIAYMVWLPWLAFYLDILALSGLEQSTVSIVFSIAYWVGGGATIGYAMTRYWGGYLQRLQATYRVSLEKIYNRRARLAHLGWLFFPPVMWAVYTLLPASGITGDRALATSVLAGLSVGIASNTLAEHLSGEKKPGSLLALAVLLASTPLTASYGWGAAVTAIVGGYSLTSLLYLFRAMKRIV